MAYGTIKVDNITFTNGGVDQTIAVSGVVQSISGDITATGTIQGATIIGTSTVSGATVTGDAGQFTTATITSGVFASGTAAAPSVSVGTTDNGLYSPGTDQLALSTNGTGRLFIDTNGNVGIGPTPNNYANYSTLTLNGTTGGIIDFEANGTICGELQALANEFRINAVGTNGVLKLYAGATERLRITSAGLVGIGTSSPGAPLDVVGSVNTVVLSDSATNAALKQAKIQCRHYTSSEENLMMIYAVSDSSANEINIGGGSSAQNYATQIGFWTAANNTSTTGTERLRITSAGNVGIGTTSPGYLIDASNSSAPTLRLTDSIRHLLVRGGSATQNPGIGTDYAGDLSFFTNGTANERARIDSSGRLLVGTSSTPISSTAVLQGRSGVATGEAILRLCRGQDTPADAAVLGDLSFGDSNNGDAARIFAQRDGGTWTSASSRPSRLVFSVTPDGGSSPTTSPSAMTINSGQEVLIGYSTDNGAYKLQVNSQIFATSAIIATSDGRYKENVATLDGCVDLVKALRPVSFDWKAQQPITRVDEDGETVVVREAHNFPDGKQVGFIAQEVEEVLADKPWLGSVIKQNVRPAVTDADGNELAPEEEFLGIAEGNLVAVLTSALKDAIAKIETLEAKVAALESA